VPTSRAAHDLNCLVSGFAAYPALFAVGNPSTADQEAMVQHVTAFIEARYAV
jgi:hypothetical protein